MNDTPVSGHQENPCPTDLWLVRHGHSLHHQTDQLQWDEVPLSREGRLQAGRLAARLSQLDDVVALYSSPLPRAWDTATPIAQALGIEALPLPDLREINFGEAGGLTMDEFYQRWPDLALQWADLDDLSFRWPGGESREEFRQRSVRVMEALVWSHPGQRFIVVSHTGIVCGYLAHLFLGSAGFWRKMTVRPASISRVEVGLDGARLLILDNVSHLE
jgi:broad specificity phosphatase PhoE